MDALERVYEPTGAMIEFRGMRCPTDGCPGDLEFGIADALCTPLIEETEPEKPSHDAVTVTRLTGYDTRIHLTYTCRLCRCEGTYSVPCEIPILVNHPPPFGPTRYYKPKR